MKYIVSILLIATLMAFAGPGDPVVKGVIVTPTGVTINQVSVQIKGSKRVVTTDNLGAFSIKLKADTATLVFSGIGYETREIFVKRSDVLRVTMQPAEHKLEEVVVVGYATQKKMSYTGSVATIRGAAPGVMLSKSTHQNAYYQSAGFDTESYDAIAENSYHKTTDNPLSTFSIDVDAASYSNIRRYLSQGILPPAGSVRVEEMINYFSYQYPQPEGEHPFSVTTELASCPWNPKHQVAMIGLQGKKIAYDKLPASNIVFLIDVSGSMEADNKLPLVKSSLHLLTDQLRPEDKVAIVVYAGSAGLVLPATSGAEKMKIKSAINNLSAGGSTAGGAGIELAYKTARENFMAQGNNRVILCTDGDFNVGASSDAAMVSLIEKQRESGVFLTVLGYGMGNYKDSKMQQLADKGNGNHAYIDDITEAKKVLINEFGGTLFTIAKDVKLQVEFNPAKVQGYRLIGYENRILAKEDFNNDKKDAGDMGSGHSVTALYEIIPVGSEAPELDSVDKLRYQKVAQKAKGHFDGELLNVKLRYKQPDAAKSLLFEKTLQDKPVAFNNASENLRFAAAVASFGMQLSDSKYKGNFSYSQILSAAAAAKGKDEEHYRAEFLQLVKAASDIQEKKRSENVRVIY
ncbi:vWA domain-containing protein [Filimonas effusa]|nr:VWA domain-containing protein [Filimonas effusa]